MRKPLAVLAATMVVAVSPPAATAVLPQALHGVKIGDSIEAVRGKLDAHTGALRKDKPEVLMISDRLVPAYRKQFSGE